MPFRALAGLLVVGHFVWLCSWVVPAFASPDADGYFAQARMIAFEGKTTFRPEVPAQHLGMHWIEKPDGEFVSRYPPGFSVMLAAAWRLFGRDATFYVNPLLASLTVGMVFLLARRWIGDGPAFGAALVQAAYATANFHALNSDSHTATAFFLIGGVLAFDRWESSGSRIPAALGGLSFGIVPAVRYAEAAAAIGVAAFLYWMWRRPERRGQVLWALAGAAGPVLATAARNQMQFGAPWRTAYSLTGESSLSLEYFFRNWAGYVDTLSTSGAGLFAVLGLVGMAAMLRDPKRRPFASLSLGIAGGILLVYCCYYIPGEGRMGERFLYPTAALYLVPAMLLLKQVLPGRGFAVAVGALATVQALHGARGIGDRLEAARTSVARSAAAIYALEETVPDGSVILGDRRLHEQIHFTGRWKLADASLIRAGRRGRGGRRPGPAGLGGFPGGGFGPGGFRPGGMRPGDAPAGRGGDGPSAMQRDKGRELRAGYTSASPAERTSLVLEDLRAWAEGADIYWVGPEDDVSGLPFASEPVLRVELPEGEFQRPDVRRGGPPGAPGVRGGPGPGGMFGLDSEPLIVLRAKK